MKIAVFSDIHGNCCALDAVLDDASRRDVDSFVCLGDVAATGPQPLDALERVVALGCPVVMGNADDILFGAETPETDDEFMSRIYDIDSWCAGLLDDSHREQSAVMRRRCRSRTARSWASMDHPLLSTR